MGGSNSRPVAPPPTPPKVETPAVTPRDRAILQVKVQRDRIQQHQRKINTIVEREVEIAKHHLVKGNKQLALLSLRRKRYQEQLLQKLFAQQSTLESLISSIEFKLIEQQVVQGLKTGSELLKQLNQEMRLEDIERMMDESKEAMEYQKEVSAMLAGKVNTMQDEREVEEELAELMGEVEEKRQVQEKELRRKTIIEELTRTEAEVEEPEMEEELEEKEVLFTE